MNRNLKIAEVILAVLLVVLTSCGGGDKETKYYEDDYRTACKDGDYQAAHDILDNLHAKFVEIYSRNYGELDYKNDKRSQIEGAASDYSAAAAYILTSEARFLVDLNYDNIPKEQLVNLFLELQPIGKRLPDGTEYLPGGNKDWQQKCADINCYMAYVKANNALADLLMNLSKVYDNNDLKVIAKAHYLKEPVLIRVEYNDVLHYQTPEKQTSRDEEEEDF